MIKKQYCRFNQGYFYNFINYNDCNAHIKDSLKPYKATIATSKDKYNRMNVKWQDQKLYMMFVLKWS